MELYDERSYSAEKELTLRGTNNDERSPYSGEVPASVHTVRH